MVFLAFLWKQTLSSHENYRTPNASLSRYHAWRRSERARFTQEEYLCFNLALIMTLYDNVRLGRSCSASRRSNYH